MSSTEALLIDEYDYEGLPESTPLYANLIAGAFAGIAEHTLMYPVDAIKTRMQIVQPAPGAVYTGITNAISKISTTEGVRSLWRGMTSVILGAGPAHAVYFGTYEFTKNYMGGNIGDGHHPIITGAAGACATICSDALMNPFDTMKQRMQIHGSTYKSVADCARTVYANEGLRAFYVSYPTTLTMTIPFTAIQFSTYESLSKVLNPKKKYDPVTHMISGGLAGAAAAAATTPLDVIKTLLQTRGTSTDARIRKADGLMEASKIVYERHGYAGFFRGLRPRVVAAMPANAICWALLSLPAETSNRPRRPLHRLPPTSDSGERYNHDITTMKIILASNRMPVSMTKKEHGYSFGQGAGGLVSSLAGLARSTKFTWYGWPGLEVPSEDRPGVEETLMRDYTTVPVYLDAETSDRHYNGFSNSILWPLFHYHPGEISFNEQDWAAYKQANRAFARAIVHSKEGVQDGDVIWVHDYHLMLLPQMLREEMGDSSKNVRIGFFLHTPFPSSEIYRILPVREELLRGLLSCDLIGFHTYDYARHFISSCARILKLNTLPNGIECQGRMVHVGTYPIGVDPTRFEEGLAKPKVQQRIKALESKFQGIKLIVGVDRLDYIKGVPQKLHAFEVFLTEHPEWIGKVVLVQVAVPSREDVEEYQNLRAVVNELVGRINGKFGTIEFMPIHFLHRSVSFDELIALYSVSDVCLISSTRDGMNLVSYEYVCTQEHRHGSLILSEFAGAAQSLNGSIIVNPWNIEDLSIAIHEAVTMPEETRRVNYEKLSRYVHKYTSAYWGASFVGELNRIKEEAGANTGAGQSARALSSSQADASIKQQEGRQQEGSMEVERDA
ncbi:glycosyltransferase family 20-domain-containing protein [Protomyces lactucae-debilis]|uniref:alpha,alpha-trehalose-phosphate synthase (UDP-forming) n=1 Tax=Protomyces lactucae-debilis TaxID=2754530 RepID=A0A1Y2F674_PROLT|nr:glycosyltransferase family 20-domain-containing protein [Protomyces lactucae-debilis]ORY79408.1 glycosyltransferase family 20-domain-containing protein [Protomyces lactucae-debilis]